MNKIANAADKAQYLQAGPIHVKFQDGELRYLYVGNKELIRRIYFAVRDDQWNTAPPQFTKLNVKKQGDGFAIELAATCKTEKADYSWTGQITGTPDGKITFTAGGEAGSDFGSNRIGLCVLYGTGSLVGQAFTLTRTDSATAAPAPTTTAKASTPDMSVFPALVSPTLVADRFTQLAYTTDTGLKLAASVTGATFDMEDQRNWGDSSFKAYAPLPYAYPKITKGDRHEQTVTVTVTDAPKTTAKEGGPVRVTLGALQSESRLPAFFNAPSDAPDTVFNAVNTARDAQKDKKEIVWGYNPAVHLPDNDTFMDNVPAIVDQAATARSFAPGAILRVVPIHLGAAQPGQPRDLRNIDPFGAAWAAAVIKYLALARVNEAGFDMSTGYAARVIERINAYSGQPIYSATVETTTGHVPIDAFAIDDAGKPIVWLVNLTDSPQSAEWQNASPGTGYRVRHANEDTTSGLSSFDDATANAQGKLNVKLAPFEVCEIRAK